MTGRDLSFARAKFGAGRVWFAVSCDLIWFGRCLEGDKLVISVRLYLMANATSLRRFQGRVIGAS